MLLEIYGRDHYDQILQVITESYNVLQIRSQVLLSLAAICLTITGFSGAAIAAANLIARFALGIGLTLVLLSSLVTLVGPLQLNWATQWRSGNLDQSLVNLIEKRNRRTAKYHVALVLLLAGLVGYVVGVIEYLLVTAL